MSDVHTISRDAIVRGLMASGTERANAERLADLEISRRAGNNTARVTYRGGIIDHVATDEVDLTPAPPMKWPVSIVLPWSHLVSDNARFGAIVTQIAGGKLIPKLITQGPFREAKSKIRRLARDAAAGAEPVKIPLRLEARVWVPDATRKHDVPNFAKCTHDALTDAIYVDDEWLYDARWIRMGVDVDRPRAEITITPIKD